MKKKLYEKFQIKKKFKRRRPEPRRKEITLKNYHPLNGGSIWTLILKSCYSMLLFVFPFLIETKALR